MKYVDAEFLAEIIYFKLRTKIIHCKNLLNPNPTGGGGVFHPPHGFLIAISLFYEKLSPNSLIFSFYMFATYFWKKKFKMVTKCHVTTPYLESGRWKLGLLSHFYH